MEQETDLLVDMGSIGELSKSWQRFEVGLAIRAPGRGQLDWNAGLR